MANIFNNSNPYNLPPKSSVVSSVTTNPSAVNPTLGTPAAQTYIKNQINPTDSSTIDNTSKISGINTQIGDLQAQQKGLKENNFGDTNQLQKNASGEYVPSDYESAKKDYTGAYNDYIKTLNPSVETTAAKTAYNDYVASANAGISGLEGQGRGIPLSIVRGNQAKLREQALQKESVLQGDIDIAQGNDTARQNAGLASVSLREKLLGLQQSPAEQAKVKAEADKASADLDKTKGETAMLGKMTEYQKAQLAQDESQFGRTYALAKLKALQEDPNSTTAIAAKDAEAISSMNLVNSLLQNPDAINITGALQGIWPGGLDRRGGTQLALNQYNQIKGMLSLENRSKLKGQGAISDFEGKTLESAASSLGTNLKDEDFIEQLKQIRGAIATSHGLNADVLLYDPKSQISQVVSSDSAGIAKAVKDGLIVTYQ